jgi:hypothetical protein
MIELKSSELKGAITPIDDDFSVRFIDACAHNSDDCYWPRHYVDMINKIKKGWKPAATRMKTMSLMSTGIYNEILKLLKNYPNKDLRADALAVTLEKCPNLFSVIQNAK